MRGKFITFEGSEGSGKSTQIELVRKYLKRKNRPTVFIREPGGVPLSEKIRDILLDIKNKEMAEETEMLLYMAARAQLVHEVIVPALKSNKTVLCDRFLDSTVVYQGFGHGMDISLIRKIGQFATQAITPDLTLIFDIDAGKGLSRIKRAKDRIEKRPLNYHRKVRAGYAQLAKKEPGRIKLIQVDKTKEEIHLIVKKYIDRILEKKE